MPAPIKTEPYWSTHPGTTYLMPSETRLCHS